MLLAIIHQPTFGYALLAAVNLHFSVWKISTVNVWRESCF